MTQLCPIEGRTPEWQLAYFRPNVAAILATFFETSTLNFFCPPFTLRLVGKPIIKLIGLNLAI